jgi:hypothetical protein
VIQHIFIDESGNFDFSPKGSRYFILTALSTVSCNELFGGYFRLRHSLAGEGLDIEEFHAAEDKQAVRDKVYDLLEEHCGHECFAVDSIVAQKNKANPSIREDSDFYAMLLKILLGFLFTYKTAADVECLCVWAARIRTARKRSVFEKTVKHYLTNELPARVPYHIFLHNSASHPMLQAADYCCWAEAKKWKDGELRPYERIRKAVRTEFDVFRLGRTEYY